MDAKKRLEDHRVQFIITLKFWKKRLVSEPSEKIVIEAFLGIQKMSKNEFKSDK